MTSFSSIACYNPFLVLLVGLVSFFGLIGFGLGVLKLCRIFLESPWKQVASVLIGILSTSLLVQVCAISGNAAKPILFGIWIINSSTGLFIFVREELWMKKITFSMPQKWELFPFFLLMISLTTNLLAAMAPSSKIDELYAYMTLPSRIVNDGALNFYLLPWEGAVFPHMLFQISLTPLHAMGFPDAGNIVSWGLSAMLVWFGWYLASEKKHLTGWGYVVLTCLVTGMYPVIWNVTGGSYSMGDLATAAAVVALLSYKELIEKTGINKFALLISVLVLGSVSSKVTLLPLGLAIILMTLILSHREYRFNRKTWWLVSFYIVAPWVILYLPILVWTFLQSGSPYGPLIAGFLNMHSVYDLETIRNILSVNRQVNIPSLYTIFENILIYFPALLWISVLFFLTKKSVPLLLRFIGLFLLILQTLILVFIVFPDPRFYGGLFQGILIIWLIYEERSEWSRLGRYKHRLALGAIVVLIPWLSLQVFYAYQFFPVALRLQDKMEFYHEKIAFIKDYLFLDKILPKDAVLVIRGENEVRLDISYAPRPVFLSLDRPRADKKVYLFCINQIHPVDTRAYRIDSLIYSNKEAVITTYRNPFRPPIIGKLDVYTVKAITNQFMIK